MANRFSSRRYWFNDLNSSLYQQQGRFGQGAKKKGKNNVYRINLPFSGLSRTNQLEKRYTAALHGDRRTHIYVYIRNCIANTEEYAGGWAAGPGFVSFLPYPAARRRQNGCISDAAASSLERLTRGCTNCLCVVTSAARSSVVRGGARNRAHHPV